MDKNTLTGFILIAAVLIGFSYFSRPDEAEIKAQQQRDSISAIERQKAEEAQKAQENAEIYQKAQAALDSTSLFYAHRHGSPQSVVLENEVIKLTLSTRGGTVKQANLKKYKNQQGGQVTLFNENDANMRFMLTGKNENIDSEDFFFTPVNVTDTSVTMRLQNADGGRFKLCPSS